jgi:hypothetical protein
MEYIYKCMMAYKYWNTKYKNIIKEYQSGDKQVTKEIVEGLQKNYDSVMEALVVCFDFIEKCDHILYDQKSNPLFGIIYVSMENVETTNPKLFVAIEKYRKWFLTRN